MEPWLVLLPDLAEPRLMLLVIITIFGSVVALYVKVLLIDTVASILDVGALSGRILAIIGRGAGDLLVVLGIGESRVDWVDVA